MLLSKVNRFISKLYTNTRLIYTSTNLDRGDYLGTLIKYK